jgi:tetratricopeptide (TPR) repeat protein
MVATIFAVAMPTDVRAAPPRMIGSLHVGNLCAAVASQTEELEPMHDTIMYQYQTLLYNAAGVVTTDSESVVAQKVGSFINANISELRCNPVDFTPANGNLLKYAIARGADPFIDDVLRVWKVGLNHVDPVDGFTVLDYIEQRGDTYKPGTTSLFEQRYKKFRAAGAKHRLELAKAGATLPPVESVEQALSRLEANALEGNFYSAIRLATIHRDGRLLNGPIQPNPAKARLWLERAEKLALANGNESATSDAHWVGMFYAALKDRPMELHWYKKAVEAAQRLTQTTERIGWAESNFELGRAYALGEGVPRDLDLALLHMGRSAASPSNNELRGVPHSRRWMGYIHEAKGDLDTAARWYRWARSSYDWNYIVLGFGKSLDAWFAARGLPKCGPDIHGQESCP